MIIVVGEALVDLVIDVSGNVTAALGGAPFNTARACGRLGADVAFVGAISTDRFGTMLAGALGDDGVSTDRVVRVGSPTTLAAAELDDRGAATYHFYIDGTSAPALEPVPAGLTSEVMFTGGLGLVLQPMAETVEEMVSDHSDRTMVMIDVNCRPAIIPDRAAYTARVDRVVAHADVVKVSDEDLEYLMPDVEPAAAAARLLERGPAAVLVTAGGEGVHVVTGGGSELVPVMPVDVVDTIGAGDSFGAGFLSWWAAAGRTPGDVADHDQLVAAVRAANVVAGVVCTRRGANPPWRAELPDDWSP